MEKHPKSLVFFEAVARTGSFTLAAEELFITQSAVSKQIKKLEDNLGFPVFQSWLLQVSSRSDVILPSIARLCVKSLDTR